MSLFVHVNNSHTILTLSVADLRGEHGGPVPPPTHTHTLLVSFPDPPSLLCLTLYLANISIYMQAGPPPGLDVAIIMIYNGPILLAQL